MALPGRDLEAGKDEDVEGDLGVPAQAYVRGLDVEPGTDETPRRGGDAPVTGGGGGLEVGV